MSKLFRLFINSQIKISNWFDRLLPAKFRIDGYQDFAWLAIPRYLRENSVIYDIGGGKNPYMIVDLKAKVDNCYVIGLDIDNNKLKDAPDDIYNKTIVADITEYEGNRDGDLVICLALLEHVRDVEAALRGIGSCLKSGGSCAIFVPSKNAIYAKANKILPERLKRLILSSLIPHARKLQGFPAYYDRCTPLDVTSCNRWVLRWWRRGITTSAPISHFSSPYTFFGGLPSCVLLDSKRSGSRDLWISSQEKAISLDSRWHNPNMRLNGPDNK